jgi:surfeit locus 1 family protein
MRRYVFPSALGIFGCAILIALGLWQVRRLAWKEAVLADITARIHGPAESLSAEGLSGKAGPEAKYTPVRVSGHTTGQELLVLSGEKGVGAGFEVIAAFQTEDGRRILLDRGYIPETDKTAPRPPVPLDLRGNLHWPEETDSYTLEPDLKANIWFARDVPKMAAALGTEEVLVVAAEAGGDAQGIRPMPISSTGIPNDHLGYAITWFSLAAVWAGMTGLLLWRIRQRQV